MIVLARTRTTCSQLLREGSGLALMLSLAMGAGVMVIGVASAVAQGGLFFATKSLKPKWSRLNPLEGAKRMFGPHALWEGAKMLLKSALVGVLRVARDRRADAAGRRPGAAAGGARDRRLDAATGLMRDVALAGAGRGRRGLRRAAPPHRQAGPDDQEGGPRRAQAERGRPDDEGADPLPPARRRAQPDDGRRTPGRRGAGEPHPRRGRAALRPDQGHPAGGRQGRRRGRRPDPRARRDQPGRAWSRTSRWPGRCTPAARSARRSRRSSTRRSPRCSRSCSACAPRGAPPGGTAARAPGEPLPDVPRAGRRVRPVPVDSSGPAAVGR